MLDTHPPLAQVLYSLVMVPWTVAFSVHEACDSDAAVHQGCVPDAVKARAHELAPHPCMLI